MTFDAHSCRLAGLTVAVGLGAALASGYGVAVAAPSDGGSSTSGATASAGDSPAATASTGTSATKSAPHTTGTTGSTTTGHTPTGSTGSPAKSSTTLSAPTSFPSLATNDNTVRRPLQQNAATSPTKSPTLLQSTTAITTFAAPQKLTLSRPYVTTGPLVATASTTQPRTVSTAAVQAVTSAAVTISATAAAVTPTSPMTPAVSAVATFAQSVLSPLVTNPQGPAADSPLAWTMLAAARRQIGATTTAQQPATQQQTSGAADPIATPNAQGDSGIARNARPTGGQVIAGSATISQTATMTTVSQSTQRAVIDWKSFNVGAAQTVNIQQPNSTAMTMLVVDSPDPSVIAGRITSNGQIILVNQNGVVIDSGAQLNDAGVILSTAKASSTTNFMNGKPLVFDDPGTTNSGITNNGTITVTQRGFVVAVAPRITQSGNIIAGAGSTVELAAGLTETVDLYGDGKLAVDITKQVRNAPLGPGGQPVTSLVTLTGQITAPSGVVTLAGAAADGIVQHVVDVEGTVKAPTTVSGVGTIAVRARGGNVLIDGSLLAQGQAAGSKGGTIDVLPTGAAVIGATARLNAAGQAGGGVIAVGTTVKRAKSGTSLPVQSSREVTIEQGAILNANALHNGIGGKVAILATQSLDFAGAITARGGPAGGNGGRVELGSGGAFTDTGTIDVSAPKGAPGTIIL